jgi:hypothetical protein
VVKLLCVPAAAALHKERGVTDENLLHLQAAAALYRKCGFIEFEDEGSVYNMIGGPALTLGGLAYLPSRSPSCFQMLSIWVTESQFIRKPVMSAMDESARSTAFTCTDIHGMDDCTTRSHLCGVPLDTRWLSLTRHA